MTTAVKFSDEELELTILALEYFAVFTLASIRTKIGRVLPRKLQRLSVVCATHNQQEARSAMAGLLE